MSSEKALMKPITKKLIEDQMAKRPELKSHIDQLPAPSIENLCCPKCGQDQCFVVEVWSRLMMFRDGVTLQEDRHEEWDDDSYCRCPICEHVGEVLEFRKDVQDFLENLSSEKDDPAK